MKWILKRRTSLNVGLVLILIVALVVASTYAGRQSRASTQQVEHTLEVLSELEHLRSELFDVETAQRGYILTSDASWLSIYSAARESVAANVQRLRDLIVDNPTQLSRLDTLETAITQRFDSLDETLSVFESQGLDAARQRITTGVGRELMNEVRQFLENMETEERNLLSERRAEATRTIRWVYLVFGAFALVGVGLLLLVYYMSRRAARDRERGKEELREREALYRQIVQQLPDMAVLLYDPQLRFTLAAGGLFEGVGGEKIEGHPMHEIVPPTVYEKQKPLYEAALRGEVNEVTGAFTGQPNRHYHSNFLPLKDTSGKIIGGMIAFRDITLQKQYEQEIESNERLLRLLIDHLPETVFVKDMDSRFLMVNSAIVKSFKANSRDDIIGKTDFDFHSHELAEQYRADEVAIMASGQARLDYEEETFNLTRNETRWLNTSKIPLLDAEGKVIGLIGVNADITERKRREKMLQNIIETAPDAMVIVNDQGTIVVANVQAQKVFGYSAEELIGASVDRLVPERLAGKHPQHRIGYFANRKTRPMGAGMELFGRRKDGSEFLVEISLSPLETEDGVLVSSVIRDITERKAVEQALRNYADELRDLYDNAPCGYHSLDANGVFTQINETELRWLGYNRNELIGKKKITDLMTPASVEHFRRNFPVFQEQGWINDLEFELIRKDGSTFFILLNATATKDAAGNFLHSRSTLFDITDRKRKDKQIAYQASLLENVNDAIFALDTQFRITFWNKAAEQIYGWTAEEAIGQTSAIFHTVMTEQQRANVLQELAEKGHYRIDVAQQRRDGTPIYIEGTSITLRDDAGNLTGYVSVNRDVTERMRRDEQISYQAHLLANVSDAIFATDLQYYITFWNKAAEQMFGLSAAEALGQPTTILGQPVSEEQRALVRRELPLHGRYQMEILYRLPDGKSIYVDNTLITLYDDAKKPTGYISVNRDITERKRKEAEIQQLYSDLQHRSTLLEAANQELEAFSYSVSHDLRAPLRAIDGFSLALIEDFGDQLNDEGKNYAQRVRTASQRMAQLIDDLLKLSRLTRAEMHLEPVDMSALAQSVIEELQDRNPERQVMIQIAPNIITHGDKALLHVVLDNLLGNAWKFTGKTAAAQIEFGICEQKDDMMTCFVRDNGAGFDMAFTNKLFGAFQRLHAINEFEGTGVGLATVKRVIHRHGGQVWAEGALAQGATFYFTLPVVVATVL